MCSCFACWVLMRCISSSCVVVWCVAWLELLTAWVCACVCACYYLSRCMDLQRHVPCSYMWWVHVCTVHACMRACACAHVRRVCRFVVHTLQQTTTRAKLDTAPVLLHGSRTRTPSLNELLNAQRCASPICDQSWNGAFLASLHWERHIISQVPILGSHWSRAGRHTETYQGTPLYPALLRNKLVPGFKLHPADRAPSGAVDCSAAVEVTQHP